MILAFGKFETGFRDIETCRFVIALNVRFPESRHSECTYWGRAECPLMAESSHSLTVNMQGAAYLGETANESKGIRLD